MTEAEWLTSNDPQAMLRLLDGEVTWRTDQPKPSITRPSDRKLRLFVCACCRAVRPRPGDSWDRFMLAVNQLEQAAEVDPFASNVLIDTYFHPDWDVPTLAQWAARDVPESPLFLRDIVGNPFRPLPLRSRHIYDHPTVLTLAQQAYEERPGQQETFHLAGVPCQRHIDDGTLDPFLLAKLADALEEAGCDSADILGHLRGKESCPECLGNGKASGVQRMAEELLSVLGQGRLPRFRACAFCRGTGWIDLRGPHVRGCWVLDLLLGKKV